MIPIVGDGLGVETRVDDLRIDEEDLAGLGGSGSGRKERFFWQYNVQAKGPKGQKLALDTRIHDPHQLNEVIDPVFSDNVQVHGIKHRLEKIFVSLKIFIHFTHCLCDLVARPGEVTATI